MTRLPRRYSAKLYPGLFKKRYGAFFLTSISQTEELPVAHEIFRGKDWLRNIDPDDRKAFAHLGNMCSERGKLGGVVRAQKAKRDKRGRFIKG